MNKRLSKRGSTKPEPDSPDVLFTIIWIIFGLLVVIAILPLLARK